jgi:DNA processing protein
LGSGPDEIYPSSNRLLAKKILDSGGALISEYPPGVRPSKWTFPARNRILSALSRSVLIVEAPKKSGSLITAAFALEQGRDLWTASSGIQCDGSLFDRQGSVQLAQDGAEVIYSGRDIPEKWNMNIADNEEDATGFTKKSGREELVSSMADFLKIDI